MWWTDYIAEINRQFVDVYDFPPRAGHPELPRPGIVPDGDYPMTIEGKLDHVRVVKGKINCCNFD